MRIQILILGFKGLEETFHLMCDHLKYLDESTIQT